MKENKTTASPDLIPALRHEVTELKTALRGLLWVEERRILRSVIDEDKRLLALALARKLIET